MAPVGRVPSGSTRLQYGTSLRLTDKEINGSFLAKHTPTPVNLGEFRLGSAEVLDGVSPYEAHHWRHPSAIENHTLTVWSLRPVGGSSWTTRLLDRVRGSCVCPWARLTRATINREAVHRRPVDSRTEAQTWLRSKPPNIRPLAPWDVLTHNASDPFPISGQCPPPHAWALGYSTCNVSPTNMLDC